MFSFESLKIIWLWSCFVFSLARDGNQHGMGLVRWTSHIFLCWAKVWIFWRSKNRRETHCVWIDLFSWERGFCSRWYEKKNKCSSWKINKHKQITLELLVHFLTPINAIINASIVEPRVPHSLSQWNHKTSSLRLKNKQLCVSFKNPLRRWRRGWKWIASLIDGKESGERAMQMRADANEIEREVITRLFMFSNRHGLLA